MKDFTLLKNPKKGDDIQEISAKLKVILFTTVIQTLHGKIAIKIIAFFLVQILFEIFFSIQQTQRSLSAEKEMKIFAQLEIKSPPRRQTMDRKCIYSTSKQLIPSSDILGTQNRAHLQIMLQTWLKYRKIAIISH